MKICSKCNIDKDISDYPKNGNICKQCKSLYIKEYYKKNREVILNKEKIRYEDNKSERIEKQKKYNSSKSEEQKKYLKEYRQSNKEELKQKRKEYNNKNKEKINENRRKRYSERIKNDINFKIKKIHRNMLRRILRYEKHKSTSELLGYNSIELKEHIERNFQDGMTWENYGEWEIDHIIPISLFDLENTPPSIVNSLDNLQPLWKIDNIKKSNNV